MNQADANQIKQQVNEHMRVVQLAETRLAALEAARNQVESLQAKLNETRELSEARLTRLGEAQSQVLILESERDEATERARSAEALLQRAYYRLPGGGLLFDEICNHMNRYAGARP